MRFQLNWADSPEYSWRNPIWIGTDSYTITIGESFLMKPHESPRINKKSVRGNSGDSWPVWNRGIRQCKSILSIISNPCDSMSKCCTYLCWYNLMQHWPMLFVSIFQICWFYMPKCTSLCWYAFIVFNCVYMSKCCTCNLCWYDLMQHDVCSVSVFQICWFYMPKCD